MFARSGSTRSGGAPSQLTSTFINELLEDNFLPEYIANILVPEGRRRHCLLASAIKTHLGRFGVSFTPDPETSPVAGGILRLGSAPTRIDRGPGVPAVPRDAESGTGWR